MIIKKELVISGRKKAEIIKDLKAKGFRTFVKEAKRTEDENEGRVEEEEEEDAGDSSDRGYDYLLGVIIY